MWTLMLLALAVQRQQPSILGEWEGQSHCVGGHAACHEENVLYRITPGSGAAVTMRGFRVSGSDTVAMGDLSCAMASQPGGVLCQIPVGTWHFWLEEDHLEGTLTGSDGTVVRRVRAIRRPTRR